MTSTWTASSRSVSASLSEDSVIVEGAAMMLSRGRRRAKCAVGRGVPQELFSDARSECGGDLGDDGICPSTRYHEEAHLTHQKLSWPALICLSLREWLKLPVAQACSPPAWGSHHNPRFTLLDPKAHAIGQDRPRYASAGSQCQHYQSFALRAEPFPSPQTSFGVHLDFAARTPRRPFVRLDSARRPPQVDH